MFAAVFPGQGSQKPGMGRDLHDAFPIARNVFDRVSEATGIDARNLCFELDEDTLRQTQNAQVALFTCGVAAASVLREALGEGPSLLAGHSVGEYAALAAAGVVSIEDGARLVRRRGELMATGGSLRPGTMAAVLGLDREVLESVCHRASGEASTVVVANDNCPGQLVISGDRDAVERAGALASESGAKRVLPLNVSGAFHSPLMHDASLKMRAALDATPFVSGVSIVANVTAKEERDPRNWPELLQAQLVKPVRWTESVGAMAASGVRMFVECGVGEVLCGLIRRIDREAATAAVFDAASLESTLRAVRG